jgi:glutaredoxin-like protein NrdH
MIVIVYTTPSCPQCRMTKNVLDKEGIRYDAIDLAQHPRMAAALRAQGLATAPVVKVSSKRRGEQVWTGFRPDLIKAIDPKEPIPEEPPA